MFLKLFPLFCFWFALTHSREWRENQHRGWNENQHRKWNENQHKEWRENQHREWREKQEREWREKQEREWRENCSTIEEEEGHVQVFPDFGIELAWDGPTLPDPPSAVLSHVQFPLRIWFGCSLFESQDGCVYIPWPSSFSILLSGEDLKEEVREHVQDLNGTTEIKTIVEVKKMGSSLIQATIILNEEDDELDPSSLSHSLSVDLSFRQQDLVEYELSGETETLKVFAIPGWLSILPLAIGTGILAFSGDNILSLFGAIFVASLLLYHFNPWTAYQRTLDVFYTDALANPESALIVLLTIFLSAVTMIILRLAGVLPILEFATRNYSDSRHISIVGQVVAFILFFDNNANVMTLGPSLRSAFDRHRISREKLSYIVDTTVSCLASVMPISTWVAIEVGLLHTQFVALRIDKDPYFFFLSSLPYRYYPLVMILFTFFLLVTKRDFGRMHEVEMRARSSQYGHLCVQKDGDSTSFSWMPRKIRSWVVHEVQQSELPLDVIQGSEGRIEDRFESIDLDEKGSVVEDDPEFEVVEEQEREDLPEEHPEEFENGAQVLGEEVRRVIHEEQISIVEPKKNIQPRFINSLIPIMSLVVGVIIGILLSGYANVEEERLRLEDEINTAQLFGEKDKEETLQKQLLELDVWYLKNVFAFSDLLASLSWAAFFSALVGSCLGVAQKFLTLEEALDLWVQGCSATLSVILILVSSWALSHACSQLRTGDFLVDLFKGILDPGWLPFLVFWISAGISFLTGTSWGAMAIVYPAAFPLTWELSEGNNQITQMVVASILSGGLVGEQCSPLSATTTFASIVCSCEIIPHVKSQSPYVIVVGVAVSILGLIPVGLNIFHPLMGFLVSVFILLVFLFLFGKKIHSYHPRQDGGGRLIGETETQSLMDRLFFFQCV